MNEQPFRAISFRSVTNAGHKAKITAAYFKDGTTIIRKRFFAEKPSKTGAKMLRNLKGNNGYYEDVSSFKFNTLATIFKEGLNTYKQLVNEYNTITERPYDEDIFD